MAEEQILLVEGEDDEHVVEHLYRKVHGAEPPFEIVNKMGYSKLLKGLPLDLKRSGLRTLGILADANDDLETRWRELVAAAEEEDVRLPDEPSPSGTLVEGDIRVGVWLMPNNVSTGELEDLPASWSPARIASGHWPRSTSRESPKLTASSVLARHRRQISMPGSPRGSTRSESAQPSARGIWR